MSHTEIADQDSANKYEELTPNELKEMKQYYIDELNMLLENYRPSDRILMFILECIISIALLAIGLSIGMVWLLVLTMAAILIIVKLGGSFTFNNTSLKEEKLAYRACVIMDFLVDIQEGHYHSYGGVCIIHTSSGRHVELYNKFIKLYPALASKKLSRLARIDIKDIM